MKFSTAAVLEPTNQLLYIPDIDGLAPVAGRGVEHVNVSVAVHEQEAVRRRGYACRLGRVHNLLVSGFAALKSRKIMNFYVENS